MKPPFEELFEYSPIAMLLVTADGEIALVNRHVERLFQYDRSELVGRKVEILVPQALRAHHPALVTEYGEAPLHRRMGQGRDLYAVRKDESQFPVEVGLNPIEVDGTLYVLSSVIDITERRKAEDRFRAAVEAAPNGMLVIDSERRIQLINQKIEEIFGYSRSELMGASVETLVPEDFSAHHPRFVESYLTSPATRSMGIGRELFGRHKSGRLVPVEIGLQPIVSGGETFVISSVVDISHRKIADAEIRRKTEELEEFSYRTSHDLRSPLKSIAGMAELVRDDLESCEYESATQNVERISGLAGKLLKLIEDILTLTRVDVATEETEDFDFDAFARTCRDKFDAALSESGIEVAFDFLHKVPLHVQPTRLTQVLDNLVGNAIKYSDPDKPERVVRVETFTNRTSFFIHVVDNGLGIPFERQDEVFGMFKRFHSGPVTGSGLGLHIVRKQVGRLGAEITFESSPDGTTFYLEFPRQHPIPMPRTARQPAEV